MTEERKSWSAVAVGRREDLTNKIEEPTPWERLTPMYYREALLAIEEFGYANPGHGYSCARMASRALGKEVK